MGHITRCLALSQAFLERHFYSLFILQADDSVDSFMHEVEFKKINWLDEDGLNNSELSIKDATWIVDSLSITKELLSKLSVLSKQRIVVIDDFVRCDYPNAIVIDWTINAEHKFYLSQLKSSDYLLGSKFVALRRPFWRPAKFICKPSIENILIIFGSGDIRSLIPTVLNSLRTYYPDIKKTVIVSSKSKSTQFLEQKFDNNTNIIFDAEAEVVFQNMKNADIAIASGGQTLYELACVGVPTISVMLIDNQSDDIAGWCEVGFTTHAGLWSDKNLINNILSCIKGLESIVIRKQRSAIGQKMIDGFGARRIVNFIIGQNNDT